MPSRIRTTLIVVGSCTGLTIAAFAVQNEGPVDTEHPLALVGGYYRGTATGEDHNLTLNADGTLRLINGGCFHQDKPLLGTWRATKTAVFVSGSPTLLRSLGGELKLRRDKTANLLVPAALELEAKANGYGTWFVFWPDGQRDRGLEISWPRKKRLP